MSAAHSSASELGPLAGDPVAGAQGTHRLPPAEFDYSMEADSRLIAGVRSELRNWLTSCGVGAEDQDALVLASSEAIANSIEHAYLGKRTGSVRISGRCDGRNVDVAVHDDGAWIPPRFRNPEHSGQLRGRGLPLISHLMDATELNMDGGTTIKMQRRLRHPRRL